MKGFFIVLLCAGVMAVSGCQDDSAQGPTQAQQVNETESVATSSEQSELIDNAKGEEMISVTGKIEYKTFEGGFYAFIANDGRQFTPQGLAPEYQQDGLALTLTGTPMPNIMTTTQFGVVFLVDSVSDVDQSKISDKPAKPVKPTEL